MKVSILALTLNEIDGVKVILPAIDRNWYDQLLVVDGGSTDGTIEWCRENGYEVVIQSRPGIRFAYLEAMPLVRGDVILSLSPDGNCPPEAIPAILEKLAAGYDLVIGSRYLGEAKSDDDDFTTAFGNWLFTRTVNLLHGGHYSDAMVIYRAFRRSIVSELDLDRDESYALPERLFGTIISWEPLMAVRAAKRKMKIAEVPVGEPKRIGGVRKLQILRWGAAYYFQFWHELWNWRGTTGHRTSPQEVRLVQTYPTGGMLAIERVFGMLDHTEPSRTFIDGELFHKFSIRLPNGEIRTFLDIFCPVKLYPLCGTGTVGEYYFWCHHLFAVRTDRTLMEDIAAVRRSLLYRDARLIFLMVLCVLPLPYAAFIVAKRMFQITFSWRMDKAIGD